MIRSVLSLSAIALASSPAMAIPCDPAFAVDGDPIGNALTFMAWGLLVVLLGAFTISAHAYLAAGRRGPRDAAIRVRRKAIAARRTFR